MEKTGTKLWVPAHARLRQHLAELPRESDFILTSERGGAYRKTSITTRFREIVIELGFAGYSPHGLRHLAGVALAEAGCTVPQIMAVLGHLTEKQALHYVRQASRTRLADDAVMTWERADQNNSASLPAEPETAIEQITAQLENWTGKSAIK